MEEKYLFFSSVSELAGNHQKQNNTKGRRKYQAAPQEGKKQL